MALRIANNIAAMNTQRWLGVSDAGMKKSLERLSSGYRINRAADDAAGLAISQSFRADIASFKVASRNTSEASSLLQVGEGAMDQIGNMLTRLKELATQAASANAATNVDKIESEKAELLLEINRIANVTEYAGTKLIDGTFGTYSAEWGETLAASTTDLDTVNGNKYAFADNGTGTTTVNFTFAADVADISAQTYTLATGAANTIEMAGADGATYIGTVSGTTLTFDTIGLTIVGDSALTTANLVADTIIVSDTGYSSMSVATTTATGTWTIADVGGATDTVTLTNGTNSQVVSVTGNGAQTLDFDQLGIKITLDSDYNQADLHDLKFVVSSSGSSTFQVGASNNANDRIDISLGDATASGLGVNAISLANASDAQSALDTIDSAINSLATIRGNVGAAQNRLSYAAANLSTTIENVQAAESVIRDVDMASEMTDFTKNQILLQAGTAMLAQANMAPQQVLSLFG
jgi:flagellin